MTDLQSLSQEERDATTFIHEFGFEEYIYHKRQREERDEQANNADFTGIEIEGSLDSSYAGDNSFSNDDITPMEEYTPDWALHLTQKKEEKQKNIQRLLYVCGYLAPTNLALAARRPSRGRFSPSPERPNLMYYSRFINFDEERIIEVL
jgi:hypothetical protein